VSAAQFAGLALALLSACCLNWGFLCQHDTASGLPPLSPRRPIASLRLLFGNPRWLAGFTVGLAGWALYVAALRLAPLSLVQAVSAGGIGMLALLVERTTGTRLSRREWTGVGAAVVGLLLLGVSLTAGEHVGGQTGGAGAVGVWIAVSAIVAALVAGLPVPLLAGGAGFGIAAGTLYAAGDVATKAAVGGGAAVLFTAAVLVCHGLAFVTLQLGFQRGTALATAGVSTLAMNALPIAAGTLVFSEALPGGGLGVVRLLAFACVVAGAAMFGARHVPGTDAQPASAARAASTSSVVL
jgi:hypothetical protein